MPRNAHTILRPLALIGALALVAPLAACAPRDDAAATGTDTMRVAYLSTANYLTTLKNERFAQDELAPATVEFTGPYNPADARTAIQSGNADATSTGTGSFINLIAQDQPWTAFAIEYYDGDSQGIVAAPGSGVESLEDLYGRTIAIDAKGATGDYIVHQAFADAGLDASQVTEVEMSPSNFSAAFGSGQVDAIATFDQNLASAMTTPGARLLVNAEEYGNLNVSIHIVARSFAQEHPDLVRAMYRALVEESDKAQEHPEIITDAYREFGASEDIIDQVAKFDVPEILPIDENGLDMLERQAAQYVDFGFIDAVPDLAGHVMDCSE